MTREQFWEKLKENGIDENIVLFDNNIKDGYCVRKNYHRWEVCLRERGKEYNLMGFPSENDALNYLCEQLLKNKLK